MFVGVAVYVLQRLEFAKETGGIILVKNDLQDVVRGIWLSRATMRKIRQNLFWALRYNAAAIPIAAFGLLNPIIAAAAMLLSSLSAVANAATLSTLRLEPRRSAMAREKSVAAPAPSEPVRDAESAMVKL